MLVFAKFQPFQSLPIFPNPARVSDVEVQRRIRDAENKMHASRSNFKQVAITLNVS